MAHKLLGVLAFNLIILQHILDHLITVICSAAKQNDRLHESYLVQGMAKILLYNFVLLPNF